MRCSREWTDTTRASQRLVNVTEGILNHEAGDTRALIQDLQDKRRLEHHGEVIPQGHHGRAAETLGRDMGHPEGKCRCNGQVEELAEEEQQVLPLDHQSTRKLFVVCVRVVSVMNGCSIRVRDSQQSW